MAQMVDRMIYLSRESDGKLKVIHKLIESGKTERSTIITTRLNYEDAARLAAKIIIALGEAASK